LHDWPDRYIHTTSDTPDRMDPTKLKRAAFIGAASGYFLASMGPGDVPGVKRVIEAGAFRRAARVHERLDGLPPDEAENLREFSRFYEQSVAASVDRFVPPPRHSAGGMPVRLSAPQGSGDSALVFARNPELRGPMSVFGYDYLIDKLGAGRAGALKLMGYSGLRGSGGEYAYEVLNLAGSGRRAIDIRNDVSAIYGPVPIEYVVEFLLALETIGVVRQVR
ncbi:MAG: hypothetical protein ACR2GK_11355, partial [Gemmatimonadaceae bacterium]